MVPRYPQMGGTEFAPGSSLAHRFPSADSRDAVVYVLVVGVLYAAIIIVLVGTNIHRFRKNNRENNNSQENKKKKKNKTEHNGGGGGASPKNKTATPSNIEDSSVSQPLLKPKNIHKSFEEDDNETEGEECIEAIEVTYNKRNKKQNYTKTIMKESECADLPGKFTHSEFPAKECLADHSADMIQQQQQMISTTVVTTTDSDTPYNRKQSVRVGVTTEEEIKPKALLEMIGDDVGDPVPV